MSYTFTLTGRSSVLSANFYPPIELNATDRYGLALVGFYTYNSIFNIDESNNRFSYKKTEKSKSVNMIIPPGVYEIYEIEKAMLTALKESTKENEDNLFSLLANNNTLKCEIKSKYIIDFTEEKSVGKMLGFGRVLLKNGIKHESTFQVDIMKVRIIRVDSNITSGAYLNSNECHILFEFDIESEPGFKITKEPSNPIYLPLRPDGRQFLDNITLRILDDNGDLINFQKEKIIVKLELKKLT